MGKREQARADARFARGEVGVDGAAVEEEVDAEVAETEDAKEQLLRGKTYLGREFLTWLLWRSDGGGPLITVDKEPVSVLFGGRIVMRGVGGEVTEVSAKGGAAPYATLVRLVLDRGLLVHQARLLITHGEKAYQATLDAEHLDVRSAKLPDLMTEEEDDRLTERLYLAEKLSALVEALVAEFITLRASDAWKRTAVPALKRWLREVREAEAKGAPASPLARVSSRAAN